jgi:hypothetical protein
MEESEWLACTEPQKMLKFLGDRASQRKLQFLAMACCRRVWHLLESSNLRKAVDVLEQFADGGADEDSVRAFAWDSHPLRAYYGELFSGRPGEEKWLRPREEKWLPAYAINRVMNGVLVKRGETVVATLRPGIAEVAEALDFLARAVSAAQYDSLETDRRCVPSEAECAAQAVLLRCIFGNPVYPLAINPAWLTPAVVSIAQAAYDERQLPSGELDFARLAVLADALEEAGCTDLELLVHLRGPGQVHVRGCWALDRVLAREPLPVPS